MKRYNVRHAVIYYVAELEFGSNWGASSDLYTGIAT